MRADIESAEKAFNDTCQKFKDAYGDFPLGMALVKEEPNGIAKESFDLVPDIFARLKELTYFPVPLRNHFVSSQPIDDRLEWKPSEPQRR
jgi:hypothetical protein